MATKKVCRKVTKKRKNTRVYKSVYNEHRGHYLPEWKAIGRAIKALRQKKGLSNAEVASKLGKSSAYYGHIEQGYNNPRTLPTECKTALAEILGVPYEVLWGD